ncbi:hypothetical protein, partial [Nitrosopumilus sp.]|uniref:hypothetical protein n=1 Tax=Nitrosopumilus sp. TaxID=2024843 RepID=UPI003D151657
MKFSGELEKRLFETFLVETKLSLQYFRIYYCISKKVDQKQHLDSPSHLDQAKNQIFRLFSTELES